MDDLSCMQRGLQSAAPRKKPAGPAEDPLQGSLALTRDLGPAIAPVRGQACAQSRPAEQAAPGDLQATDLGHTARVKA